MNKLHPAPIPINLDSSQADTAEACARYNIKPPHLNADLFEKLLQKTDINENLQESLVKG